MAIFPTYPSPRVLPQLSDNEAVAATDVFVVFGPGGPKTLSAQRTSTAMAALNAGLPAATVTITNIVFTPLALVPAGSAADTPLGSFSASVAGGALINPVYTLVTSAGGDFKLVGAQVQLAVGNVPAGSYTIRARLSADNMSNAAPGFEKDFTVTIAAPQAAPGPNTGANYDFGYGRDATLAIPFPHKAKGPIAAGDVLTIAQGFAANDVPVSWRLMGQVGAGTPFEIQRDLDNTHAGSLRTAALAWAAPVALADGAEGTFTIKAENTPPNRTPFITAAGIAAAKDYKVILDGFDYAGAPMEASFNWIIANCPEVAANGSRGTNAIGGWEYRKKGPRLVEVMAWCYVRRVSDGAMSRWQRCDMYVSAAAGSPVRYKIDTRLWQPNAYAAHPAGTIGPAGTAQLGIACVATLKNGSTTLDTWGGTNDSRAFDVSASAFANGRLTLPTSAFNGEKDAHGVPVSFSGTLPSGLSASNVYYLQSGFGSRNPEIFSARLEESSAVSLGSAGSGTIRVMPVCHTFPNCSTFLAKTTGQPVWDAAGNEPQIIPSHDLAYLGKRARLVPNYDLSYTVPVSGLGEYTYTPGAAVEHTRDWQGPGDDAQTDRIGVIPYSHARALRCPYDAALHRNTIVKALVHGGHIYNIGDERAGGRPVVHIRGLDGVGGQFPGMGPTNNGFRAAVYQGGNPTFGGSIDAGWNQNSGYRKSGINYGYGMSYPGEHATQMNLVPYIRTGRTIFADLMESMAFATAATEYADYAINETISVSGVVVVGGRGSAWRYSIIDDAACVMADSNPARAVLEKLLDDAALAHQNEAFYGQARHLGILFGRARWWMLSFFTRAVTKMVLRGRRDWRASLECMARGTPIGVFDDEGAVTNASALLEEYHDPDNINGPGGVLFPTLELWIRNLIGNAVLPATGYSTSGYGRESTRSDYSAINTGTMEDVATAHEWGLAYIPTAERVRAQAQARRHTAPNSVAGPGVEQWAFAKATLPDAARVLLTQAIDSAASGGTITGPASAASTGVPATFAVTITGAGYLWVGLRKASDSSDVGTRKQVRANGNVTLTATLGVSHKAGLFTAAIGGSPLDETAAFNVGQSADNRGPYIFEEREPVSHQLTVGATFSVSMEVAIANGTRYPGDVTLHISTSATVYNAYPAGGGPYQTSYYQNNDTDFVFYNNSASVPAAGTYYLWARTDDGYTAVNPAPYTAS